MAPQCSPSWIFKRATFRSLWLRAVDTLQLLYYMGSSNTSVHHRTCHQPQVHSRRTSHQSWVASTDDMRVHGKDLEEHDWCLNEVLSCLDEHNLSLNKGKCQFAVREVDLHGYRLSASGILPLGSNVKTILDLWQPQNVKEVPSFVGTSNFKFGTSYSMHKWLNQVVFLCTGVPWKWTEAQSLTFASLKEKITSSSVLAHFDPDSNIEQAALRRRGRYVVGVWSVCGW